MSAHITRPNWREILHDAATTQHTAALTWTECRLALRALEDAEAGRDRHGPCVCNTGPGTEGPDEYCPQHGRTYDDALDVAHRIVAGERACTEAAESRARDLEAEVARLRALLAEDVALLEELDAAWGGAGGAGS